MSEKVLFIGGTGNISLPCVAEAVSAGYDVTVFNRSVTGADLPPGVTSIAGDLKDPVAYDALGKGGFDVVCQFIAFAPAQVARGYRRLLGQYRPIHLRIVGVGLREAAAQSHHHRGDAYSEPILGLQPEQDRL